MRKGALISGLCLALLTSTWSIREASAASFDCTKRNTIREKLVCHDPTLSGLDTRLAQAYAERRALLSGGGAIRLKKSELSWLNFVDTVCPTKPSQERITDCVVQQYEDRLKDLASVGMRAGPYVFNRIDLYLATPAENDGTGVFPGFFSHHVAYPQIDNAANTQAIAWNIQEQRTIGVVDCDGGEGDEDADYTLLYVTASMISVRKRDENYCHGTPHGHDDSPGIETTILFPSPHQLTTADLFGPGTEWEDPFDDAVWNLVKAEGWSNGNSEDQEENQIASAAEEPTRWQLTPVGLKIVFREYDGGCYACTPLPVTIPWPQLRPYMSSHAVMP